MDKGKTKNIMDESKAKNYSDNIDDNDTGDSDCRNSDDGNAIPISS